jgi:hypothetical protein
MEGEECSSGLDGLDDSLPQVLLVLVYISNEQTMPMNERTAGLRVMRPRDLRNIDALAD